MFAAACDFSAVSRRACFNERGKGASSSSASVNSAAKGNRRTLERALFSAERRRTRLLEGRQTMKSPVRGSFQSANASNDGSS